MKRILLIAILSLFFLNVKEATTKWIDYTSQERSLNRIEDMQTIEPLLRAIITVECNFNFNAVGKDGDTGPFQITTPRLLDYNLKTGKNYKLSDCFDLDISLEIFMFYARRIGTTPDRWEIIARNWNGGRDGYKMQSTEKYWEKVTKHLNKSI